MDITWRVVFLLVAVTLTEIEGARILAYFPTPSISHQVVFRRLTHALAARGHEVTVVTPDPVYTKSEAPANLTEINVHDISYALWGDIIKHHTGNKRDLLIQVKNLLEKFTTILDAQLQTAEVREIFKKDKNHYDLLILEACNRAVMGFSHIFNAPVITVSSFGAVPVLYSVMGAPVHPILYPTAGSLRLYNLSLLEKSLQLLGYFIFDYLVWETEAYDHRIMQKNFGEDVPEYYELTKNIKMMFLNEHPLWADNRPVPPSILYIGGIHQNEEKELPRVS